MSLLAVDIGSSTCKAAVFAAGGEVLAQSTLGYVPIFPRPSFAEMEPEKFWNAVRGSCHTATKNLKDPVQAVCLSSHGETFVAVDSHGRAVSNAILNQDSRAIDEAASCEQSIGRERLFEITGLFSHPMYPVPKILWLRKHEPEVFRSAKSYLSLIGYLLLRMGLPPLVDYSLASRFLAFDIRTRTWSEEILAAAELDRAWFPVPAEAGTIVGKLNSESASELGVQPGTPVVLGGHDQPCGALGAGVIRGGRVSDSIGTYECLVAASDAPSLNQRARDACLNTYCHVVPDKFVTLAYFPSGIMVKWFHDLLYANGSRDSGVQTTIDDQEASHYAFLEAHSPLSPTGLCITPHLIGSGNPEFNSRARGVIFGLGPGTDRSHLYKGILEGLACELSILTEVLAEAVGPFNDIFVTGGGIRSRLGLQLRAAMTGRRLHILRREETVCLGTAILAGLAIGEYASVAEAVTNLVEESAVFAPDKALAESYRDQIQRYKELRAAVVLT